MDKISITILVNSGRCRAYLGYFSIYQLSQTISPILVRGYAYTGSFMNAADSVKHMFAITLFMPISGVKGTRPSDEYQSVLWH